MHKSNSSTTLISIITGLFLIFSYSTSHAAEWELAKDKNGIKVYTQDIPNSNLKKFKGVTTVDAEFSKLVGLIENIPYSTKWMHDVTTAKLVKKISDIEQYAYIVQSAPIVKSRDFIAKALVTQDPKTLAFTIIVKTTPEGEKLVPPTDKYIRMTSVDAHYKFTPLENGKRTIVELEVAADPAGSIPTTLINIMAVSTPYKTLENIKKINLNDKQFIPTCVPGFDILGQDCRKKP